MSAMQKSRNFYPLTIVNMYLNELPGLPKDVQEDLDTSVEFAQIYFPKHIFERRIDKLKDGAETDFDEKCHLRHCGTCRHLIGL